MIEMKTAFFFLGCASLVFSLLLSLTARKSSSKRITAILAWAKLAQAVAFLLFFGRTALPDVLSKNVGNGLLFTGFSLEAIAAWLFVGKTGWKEIVLPVPVIFLLLMNSGLMSGASDAIRVAMASLVLAYIMIMCSLAFLRGKCRGSDLAFTIGVTDGVVALANIARGATALSTPGFNLLTPYLVQYLAIGSFLLFIFTNGFGFLLLINEEDDRQLKKKEKLFRNFFEHHAAVKLIVDPRNGNLIDANKAAQSYYGWPKERLTRMRLHDIVLLSSEEVNLEMSKVAGINGLHCELRHRLADGSVRDVEVFSSKIVVNEKELLHLIVHDITERKQAEETLRFRDARLLLTLKNGGTVVFAQDKDLVYTEIFNANPLLTEEMVLGKKDEDLFCGQDAQRLSNIKRGVLKTGISAREEVTVTIGGDRYIYLLNVEPVYGEAGEIEGIWCASTDITRRKRAEQALFKQSELQRVLLSTIPAFVYVKDTESVYLLANKGFSEVLCGVPESEIPGKTDYDLFPAPVAEKFRNKDAEILATGRACIDYEETGTEAGGNKVWFSTSKCPFFSPSGEIAGVIGICIDVTARKQAEEERLKYEQRLLQVRKAESLARMAGAIAHNFNNLLSVVIGNLELAMGEVFDGAQMRTCIGEAVDAARRAAKISRFMLTYLGQSSGKADILDPVESLREACGRIGPSLPKSVRLNFEIPFSRYAVKADGAHLTRIITNLIENAGEAIGEREGEISLDIDTVAGLDIKEGKLFPVDWKTGAEEYARITIADTGCGIDPDLLDNIFDPFFSTRFTGRGLGLAVVLGLLRTANGAIAVESLPGRGTCFKLFLPLLHRNDLQAGMDMALKN